MTDSTTGGPPFELMPVTSQEENITRLIDNVTDDARDIAWDLTDDESDELVQAADYLGLVLRQIVARIERDAGEVK
jgi:hypothetical protein